MQFEISPMEWIQCQDPFPTRTPDCCHLVFSSTFQVWINENESCSVVSDSLQPHELYSPWNSPGQNTSVDSLSLLHGIFPTQELNWSLLHCRRILYQQSHQGIPRILEWAAYPFCSGSSRPRNRTQGLLHCKRILYQRFAFLLTLERYP